MKYERVSPETTIHELLEEQRIAPVRPGTIKGHRVGGDPADEAENFYLCPHCAQAVDMRDLGEVLHHETPDHSPLPTES